jgi:hypothetical protein
MFNRIRKTAAAGLLLGVLASGALVLGTAATANAAPAKTTVSTATSHAVKPNICRFGCI